MLYPLWVSLHSISNKNIGVLLSIRRSTSWSTGEGWVAGLEEPAAYSLQSLQCQIWMRRNVCLIIPKVTRLLFRIVLLPHNNLQCQSVAACFHMFTKIKSGIQVPPHRLVSVVRQLKYILSANKLASVLEWCWAQWRPFRWEATFA